MELETPATGTEPLLCLAARAAWELWGTCPSLCEHWKLWGTCPSCGEQSALSAMGVQVVYGEEVAAAVAVTLDSRGATYTGWTLAPVMRLKFSTTDGPHSRDPQHWLAQLMTLTAFGRCRPPDVPDGDTKLRFLPSFWQPGELPVDVQEILTSTPQQDFGDISVFAFMFEYE
jgi:hypothetical protein